MLCFILCFRHLLLPFFHQVMNHDGYIHASDDKVLNVIVIVDRSQHYAHDRWNYQNLQISDILTETHFFGAVFVSYSH